MQTNNTDYETKALAACVEIGKLLTSTLNLKEILKLIVHKVSELIEAKNWSLLLKDQETEELTFEIVIGVNEKLLNGVRLAPGEGIAGHVVETGRPEILQNVKNNLYFNRKVDDITSFDTQSVICVPLKTHGRVLGVLEIVNVTDMAFFEEKYFPILMILADYAAIAIENSQHCDRIINLSITDEYTGLYNARYLYQVLDKLVDRSIGKHGQFALVFMDIDNFKDIVDTYGHMKGSMVLKEVGQTISSCIHEKDILIKYGGDEYIIIFPDKSKKEAISGVEKILFAIRNATYLESEKHAVHLTASFGIAMYPDDDSTSKELLIRADNIMYSVKRSTKNGYGVS
jgi:diguanylate cyclase (GGDEF)-like protein